MLVCIVQVSRGCCELCGIPEDLRKHEINIEMGGGGKYNKSLIYYVDDCLKMEKKIERGGGI